MSTPDEIHSCSYYCERPACIKAQRDEMRDRLAAAPAEPVAPAGWKLVPVESTIEMILAVQHEPVLVGTRSEVAKVVWSAMLDAAPKAQERPALPEPWWHLYRAINEMMAYLGKQGEISARGDRASAVMDALHAIDGGTVLQAQERPSAPRQERAAPQPEFTIEDCAQICDGLAWLFYSGGGGPPHERFWQAARKMRAKEKWMLGRYPEGGMPIDPPPLASPVLPEAPKDGNAFRYGCVLDECPTPIRCYASGCCLAESGEAPKE